MKTRGKPKTARTEKPYKYKCRGCGRTFEKYQVVDVSFFRSGVITAACPFCGRRFRV